MAWHLDSRILRMLVAVAEAPSAAQAAARLNISPSALSQAVRGLEERLGARLLNRTTRSVSLTDAGALLLERARPALDELGQGLDAVRGTRGGVRGGVRVVSFRTGARLFLAPALGPLLRERGVV